MNYWDRLPTCQQVKGDTEEVEVEMASAVELETLWKYYFTVSNRVKTEPGFQLFPIHHQSLDTKARHLSLRGDFEKQLTTSTNFWETWVSEEHQCFYRIKLRCHGQHTTSHPSRSSSARGPPRTRL